MKRILFTLAVIGATALSSTAQTTTTTTTAASPATGGAKFSIGAEAGLPLGDASEVFSTVIGGSLKLELPTGTNTFFTLSAGYSAYLTKSEFKDLGAPGSTGFVPIKAGIKYYSDGNFFLEGQAGIVFSTESGGGHLFVYSPGIGYSFIGGFEVGVRYEAWTNNGTTGQVGLRLGYRF
ncbi:MAG TPA: hypothetical protein VK668_18095 [Mucilaginibacter sp.]|nr:hypothetical protein [Mucilaginibacter sp.]